MWRCGMLDFNGARVLGESLEFYDNACNTIRLKMEEFREDLRKYVEENFNQCINLSKEKLYVWVYWGNIGKDSIIRITHVADDCKFCNHYEMTINEFEKIYKIKDTAVAFEEIKKHKVEL